MLCDLHANRVDQFEGAACKVAFVKIWLNPDGHERCSQIASMDGIQVDLATVERIGEIEVLVDEALRSVFVGVDDKSGAMDLLGRALGSLSCGSGWLCSGFC